MHYKIKTLVFLTILASASGCVTQSRWKYNKFQGLSGQVSAANAPSSTGRVVLSLLSQEGKHGYSNVSFFIPAQQVAPKTQFKCIAGKSQLNIEIDGSTFGEIQGKCQSRDTIIGIPDESKQTLLSKIMNGKRLRLKSVGGDSYSYEDEFNISDLAQ